MILRRDVDPPHGVLQLRSKLFRRCKGLPQLHSLDIGRFGQWDYCVRSMSRRYLRTHDAQHCLAVDTKEVRAVVLVPKLGAVRWLVCALHGADVIRKAVEFEPSNVDKIAADAAVLGVAFGAVDSGLHRFAAHAGDSRNGLAFHDVDGGLEGSIYFQIGLTIDYARCSAARACDANVAYLSVPG